MVQHSRLEILGQQASAHADRGSHVSARRAVLPREDADPPSGPRAPVHSLYIHIPFCFHKCHYCDFYSFVDNRDQQPAFVDRLERELTALGRATGRPALRTIFVGGGTPSLLRVELWERLLCSLHVNFDLSAFAARTRSPATEGSRAPADALEFTVECNPETVSAELMATLRTGGVNRVSIGAQSFNPRHLKTLERWHDPDNVARAVQLARDAGIHRRSIDLINSIPGQTLDEWAGDLDRALALQIDHLSCYTLTYEPGTAMTKRLARGDFEPADDDLEAAMYEHTLARLRDAGFQRYEISNFARTPADQSLHNLAYWRQDQWLAAGPSASGHLWRSSTMRDGSWRWKNVPRLGDYLAFDDDGFAPVTDLEPPDPARLLRERIMMGLRLEEGLDAESFLMDASSTRPAVVDALRSHIARLRDRGLMHPPGPVHDRWTLTDRGMLLADHLASELMRLLA